MNGYSPHYPKVTGRQEAPFSVFYGVGIGLPDYPALAQLDRITGQLDAALQRSAAELLRLGQQQRTTNTVEMKIQDRIAQLNHQMRELEDIERLKDQINSTKAQIVKLRDSLSKQPSAQRPPVLYASVYKLHNITVKLVEELSRQQARQSQLQFINRKQTEDVVQMNYRDHQLKSLGETLNRQLEQLTVNEYINVEQSVRRAKYEELMHVKNSLVKSLADSEGQYRRAYSSRMDSLLPLLDEAKHTDMYLQEISRTIVKQQLELKELQEQEDNDLEDFPTNRVSLKISRSGTKRPEQQPQRVRTELDDLKEMYDKKQSERTVKKLIELGERNIRMSAMRIEESKGRYETIQQTSRQLPKQTQLLRGPRKDLLRVYSKPNQESGPRKQQAGFSLPALVSDKKVQSSSTADQSSPQQQPRKRTRRELLQRKGELMQLLNLKTEPETSYSPKHRLHSESFVDRLSNRHRVPNRDSREVLSPVLRPPFRLFIHSP